MWIPRVVLYYKRKCLNMERPSLDRYCRLIAQGSDICMGKLMMTTGIMRAMAPLAMSPLQWRHNGHDGVWNHQHHHCLLNRLLRRRSKKTSKLRVTGLCAGNSPVTGEFPAQMASNAEMFPFEDVIMPIILCNVPELSRKEPMAA